MYNKVTARVRARVSVRTRVRVRGGSMPISC
jgi:hypothetical protein